MIKQQNAGAMRFHRRVRSGRGALMLSAGAMAMVLAQPALAQVLPDALPTGGTIVTGTGGIGSTGSDMTVTQTSDRLVIDWDSFDIGEDASVHFDMDATDIVVNRDNAGDPSEIYGSLSGDGMIMILNPNGVLFGAGANVNVGSLVATTGSLADASANLLSFAGASGSVTVAAGATITVAEAGLAAFVAPSVANNGIITATGGHVFLGGAEGFTLDLANDGLLELTVPASSPLVQNHGSILAAGGRIQMSAAAASALVGTVINTSGVLSVASASSDDGVIVLEAAGNDIEVSGDLSAEGDIEFSARRVFGSGDVDVDDGALTLNIDPDGADTTGETLIADALGVIGAVEGGTTLNLAAGDYAAGATINAANVTVDGGGVARIIADQHGQDGLIVNGTGDGAVIQGLNFIGQADTSYNGFAWGGTITRGVVLRNGAENVTVTNNVITGVRNGILIDGRNDGSVITDNVIDNTKSAISVQYTDGSNLTLAGNAEGVFGNEWGINVHLNGVWNGSTISPSAGSLGANPSAAAQQHLLDLSNANSGMSVYNQAYSASNRTHVYVDAGGSPAGQGAAPTPISTVHGGVAAVVNGGHVFVADGVYNFAGARLVINKSLTLTGESEEGVILDGRSVGGGLGTVLVSADNVTLSNFTLYGADSGVNNYGIKVQPNPTGYDPNQRIYNFTINDVTVRGSTRAELDLNGVVGATITNFTADGRRVGDDSHESGGAGIQITDSADITLTGVTTLGNAWGSVAIYQSNRAGAYNGLTTNINIDAGENTFNEFLGVFVQSYSTLHPEIGQLNLTGFDFAVRNTGHRADGGQFTFFRTDLDDATDFALNIGAAETSSIEGWSGTGYTNTFTVVDGLTIGAAIRDVRSGGFINVGAGTYGTFGTAFGGPSDLTITGADGAVIDGSGVTGRIVDLRADGTTLSGFTIQGDGGGVGVSVSGRGVTVSDNVIEDVLTGVQTTTQYAAGNAAITGNTITADYGVSLQNTGNTVSGNTVNAAVEGVGLLYAANSFSGNTFTVAAGADALNYYGAATYVGLAASNNTVSIEGGGLQGALDLAGAGGSVDAGAATYNETATIRHSLTLTGAGMDETAITGGIAITGAISDLTLAGFSVSGNGGSNTVIRNSGVITGLTVDGVRIDGESVAGRFGFVGGQIGGDISITDSEFLNINGWAVFDTRSGAGTNQGSQITSAVFSGNTLDNVQGHIAFRQDAVGAFPDVVFANNTVTNVGNATNSFGAIFKAFNADVVTFSDNDVSDVGTSGFNPGGEAAYGAVLMVRGASQLNVTGNTFTNNHMVFAVEPNRGLPTATTFTGNTFTNNAYGVYMPGTALAGGSVTFGAGNNFVAGADTVQHIVWRSAGALDLTGVMFDGQLASAMSLADQLALEDLITHGVDRSGAGLATVVDGQIFVTEGSGSNALNRAVNLAASGDTVNVGDGDHVITSTVNVDDSIAIIGQSRAGTVIDGTAIAGYGMEVNADDVTLANFTFQGNNASTSSSHYGIKVQPDTGDASDRVHDFTIRNVAIQGWGGSELDLNGVVGALIDGVIADGQGTKGVGIGLTDSADVTIVNSETLNNLWGSVALYQTNRYYDQQLDNITINADLNTFGEALGVFSQSYSDIGLEIGDLNLIGFDYAVRNTGHRANGDEFTFFRTDLNDAVDFALNIGAADTSSIEGWSGTDYTNVFTVVNGLTIGAAIRDVRSGGFINVGAGTYGGFGTAFGGPSDLTITGADGAVIDGSGVTGRIVDLRADGTSLSGFTIRGGGGGVGVSISGRGVTVSDNVIEDVLTGVQTTTQYAAGDATITDNTITADYGVSLQNTGNTVSGNTVNAAVEGVGLLYGANSFSGNVFNMAAGADALNYYGAATYVGLTTSDNTITIEGGGLQGALDLAGAGGSVDAGAATYDETVTIRHSLTLTGAGQSDTIINGGVVIAGHAPAGSSIDGLTIEGLTVNAGAGQVGLIALSNSVDGVYNTTNLTVTDVTINGNGQHAVGLFDVNGATFDNVTINAAAGFNGIEAIGLNGFFMSGGAVHGALTGINLWELAGYEANDGLVFVGVDFADNRTHLSLEGAGAELTAILAANSFDRTVHATDGDTIYGDLAFAVADAATGSELNLSADTFALTSALIINRTMTLVGAGQGQTIIDASGAATYGIRVHADDVSLSDFTLSGGSGYGIKVEAAGSPTPDQRRNGFSITGVTIENTGRTGLDLNAVIGATIDGVTVTGVASGTGISITDSADVTVRNSVTSGNAWGGLALYQRNNIGGGGSDQQLTDIVIEESNDFGEDTSVYVQVYNSALHDVGALTVAGFDFVVQNDALDGGVSSYAFFDRTLQDAIDRGVNLANASDSVVGGWSGTGSDGNLYVGFGDLIGGGQGALSIQTAFDASGDGDTIHIAGGDYGQSATLDEARAVLFDDAGVGLTGLTLTTGAAGSGLAGRVTASGDINIQGDIILNDDLTLTGSGVSLAGVDGSSVNGQTLVVDGDAISIGSAGAATALRNLMIFGDTTLTGGAYNAFGFAVTGSTTLENDAAITVDGPLVMGAVNGAHALSITAGGTATVGEVGAIDALTSLDIAATTITTSGASTTGGQSYTGDLTLQGDYAAGGSFNVNGAATLGGDVDVDADTIVLGAVDGEHDLSLNADGAVSLGDVGAIEALASLTASGASIATAGAATTGSQVYTGVVSLSGDYAAGGAFSVNGATTLNDDVDVDAGAITLGAVDGGHGLTLAADGAVVLGAVGADEALVSLTASGATITTAGAATTGGQSYTGATTLDGDYAAGGAFSVNGATTLGGDVDVDASAITLGAVDGEHSLSLGADGAISLGATGADEALASLTVSGATITTAGAATTGGQSYIGALILDGDYAAGGSFSVDGATTLGGATSVDAASIALASVDGEEDLVLDADGTVVLGAVGSDEALASLTASGASIATSGAATTGAQSYAGATTLDGDYAAGGPFSVNGATTLGGATSVDASSINLASVDGEEDLTLAADGAVVLGAVGSDEALASLTASGASIVTAGAATTGGQSYTGALTLDGDYAAGGSFSVNGATTLGGATSVHAASISLASVDGEEDLTLAADGAVVLGAVGADEALASLTASGATITTAGAATTGDQAYTGALTLDGDYAAGGAFSVDGATTLAGATSVDAASISLASVDGEEDLVLAADGAVMLGAVGSTEALASLTASGATIATGGAATTGSQAYTGALTLDGEYTAGGSFSVNGATALGGATSVDAASIALASVDGEEDLVLTADGALTLGAVGADEALASLTASGATVATAGAATTGAQSYTGALTLDGDYAAGGSFSVNGATTLASDVQIVSQDGAVMLGLIDGAHGLTITAVSGDVTLGPVGSTIAVDDLIVSGGVVTTAGAASTGLQSWSGDQVRLSGGFTTRGGDFIVSGPAILNRATTITTSGGDASLESVDGASAGGQAFRINAGAGSVELGSLGALARLGATMVVANSTVLNGDTYAANSLSFMGSGADATVRLTELLTTFNTVQSADQAGAISIAPHLIGTVDGQQGVVFLAGTGASAGDGDITLTDAGTEALRLGLMTATGGDFSAETVMLAGDFTSTLSGDQVFSDDTLDTLGDVDATVAGNERGPINAGGSVTLNVGGSSNGSISAGGPVTVTTGGDTNRAITSGGAVVLTSTGGSVGGSVQTNGPVTINSAGTITGSYAAGGTIVLNASQPINVQVNGGVVQVNAPGGVVGGVFNQISTDARGTFVINGEAVIGAGSADARQILTDGFIAPVGGVIGPTGLIQLPVGLALALISPAGEGEGQRPAVLVNDVDRLGELLRLGYTAIVIQIDESGLLIEEELILADTEQQQAAGVQ